MAANKSLIPVERIEQAILLIRGQKVMLDAELAALYGVPTKALNQAVKRNERRFPPDFMFRLTKDEKKELVANCDHVRKIRSRPKEDSPAFARRARLIIPGHVGRVLVCVSLRESAVNNEPKLKVNSTKKEQLRTVLNE
jgi:hypothetical protein